MSPYIVFHIITLGIVTALFFYGIRYLLSGRFKDLPDTHKPDTDIVDDDDAFSEAVVTDYNKDFLDDPRDCRVIEMSRCYVAQEAAMLQSLLASAGIKSYLKNVHMNNMMGGFQLKGYTDITLSVFADDTSEAAEIILDFINQDVGRGGRKKETVEMLPPPMDL